MWRLRSFFLILSVVAYTIFFGIWAICISPFDRRGDFIQKIAIVWAKMIIWTNLIKVGLSTDQQLGSGPYVVVCNHQSLLDIPALLVSLPFEYRMVAKRELFRIPIFGWGMKLAGYIEVDRGDTRKAIRGMSAADMKIEEGKSIVIFAEGTRSRDGNLLPLKKGAFVLAIKNGVPILPCIIHGGHSLLPKGTLRMGNARMRVHLGNPISTEGLSHDDRDSLRREVESWMRKALSGFNQSNHSGSKKDEGRI
ncbi:MAG: lysophospholipid acyltransferase family protein [Candidatus Glassbacteria bacterium]